MKDLKPFVVDTRLEEYMKSSKWKRKIFTQDEKTCFKDGFDDGFNMAYKELELFEKENEQLKQENKRAKVLLKATLDLLQKQKDSHYVLNLLEITSFYDEAECDGYCLFDDIEIFLNCGS